MKQIKTLYQNKMKTEKAIFGAGCFWHIQEAFDKLPVIKTTVGYTGGSEKFSNLSYEQVSSGKTGSAESIQIIFDPKKISYERLLEKFWELHNPTTLNRQGLDIGTQYRSIIFYHNKKQKEIAEKSLKNYQKNLKKPIVTEIIKAGKFFKAEEYHQKYNKKNKSKFKNFMRTCGINISK